MAVQPQQRFGAPIPGQAMTAGLNSRPWLNPPQYNTVEDAMEFYFDKLSTQEHSTKLFDVIKKGLPITSLAETITTGGVMQGLHTIDVGLLLNPIIIEFVKGMCEVANVKYTLDTSVPEKDTVNMQAIQEVIESKLQEKEQSLQQSESTSGLMSRKEEETE